MKSNTVALSGSAFNLYSADVECDYVLHLPKCCLGRKAYGSACSGRRKKKIFFKQPGTFTCKGAGSTM